MFDLSNIKTILQVAGISQLYIDFDENHRVVNAYYVFRGKPGTKRITYQEVIDNLTIGMPGQPVAPGTDPLTELTEITRRKLNNGLKRT